MKILGYLLFSTLSLLLFSACKKNDITNPETGIETPVPPKPGKDTSTNVPPPVFNRTIEVGTGSGNLLIDGNKLSLKCKDLIKIKGGTYKGIIIQNIVSDDGCPITIKNNGLVQISGDFNQMDLINLKNVTISGDGTDKLDKGFLFTDNSYRAVTMNGNINSFTLQNVAFKNIGNYVVSYLVNKNYTGSEDSYSKNLRFLNISCDNTNQFLTISGTVKDGNISGLVKNLEIAYLDFQNSPNVGSVVYVGNGEDYNIHNNRINNINTNNNNHNGIFQMCGNGSFYNNYVSNHQGNAIRAWGHSIGSTPKNIFIYNNIVVNSRKYSGFEVQAYRFNIIGGTTTYTNAKVFNNTCGNLNSSNDWVGSVVDVYSLMGGTCDVFNNIGYNFQPGSGVINQQADLKPNGYTNLYFKDSSAAGLVDQSTFRLTSGSSAKNSGSALPFVVKDFYGNVRSAAKPSLGAVE